MLAGGGFRAPRTGNSTSMQERTDQQRCLVWGRRSRGRARRMTVERRESEETAEPVDPDPSRPADEAEEEER